MDAFTINLDMASKSGSFTSTRALGAYTQIAISVYNFRASPDLTTLTAKIYADTGTVLSNCTTFVADGTVSGMYNATLTLSTDTAIAYFSTKKPNFSQDLTIVVSDSATLYCNARIQVKNNPNAIPTSPTPITTWFVMEAPQDGGFYVRSDADWVSSPDPATILTQSDEGFTADLGGASEVFDMNDSMTAAQVRRGLITLTKYLHDKGVI
jgi:hypothetical protein